MPTEEIDILKLESKRTIDLVRFVDAKDIDPRYFERPDFLGIGCPALFRPFRQRASSPTG